MSDDDAAAGAARRLDPDAPLLIASGALSGEVVFIESDVPDIDTLLAGIGAGREIHILDAGQDGLAQIAAILAGRSGLTALHLVSHGSEASANLGTLVLDKTTAQTHADELAGIGQALAPGADILLYGCNVGAGADGAALLGELAIRTGADVAASDDLTGSAALGGDWTLEVATGDITAAPLVEAALAETYAEVLSISSATLNFGTSGNFFSSGGKTSTGDVIYSVNGQSGYRLVIDGATRGVINYGNGYVVVDPTAANETLVTMSFQDGNVFTANSLTVVNYEGSFPAQSFTFRGYDASNTLVATNTKQSVGTGVSSATFTFTGMTAITTLKMSAITNSGQIHYLSLDDLVLSNIEAAPCFTSGTRIATLRGDVAVEALQVGDMVPAAMAGRPRPVVWLGWRSLDLTRHARPQDAQPVRIAADAFAPGQPARDLWLSPDHAVLVEGALIPIRYLLNGSSIRQEARTRVTYWHVELDGHDVIAAEGLACESFLDTGNRAAFANGGAVVQAHPDFARAVWSEDACAPLHTEGPAVRAARGRLLARAGALGFALTREPGLHLAVGARRVMPLPGSGGGSWLFELPPAPTGIVRLRSRTRVPAEMDPASTDGRRLGVLVQQILLDGAAVALDGAAVGEGWHAPEPGLRWTAGDGVLHLPPGGGFLEVDIAPGVTYWADPADSDVERRRGA